MAKTPGTPKAKAGAPAQFDMNSRERKGGKPGGGGPGRNRDEKRPPSRIMSLPPTSVDRGEGWVIQKVGKIDQASHVAMGAEYRLIFEGHEALVFDYLGAARERAKEGPPEPAPVVEAAVDPEVAAMAEAAATGDEAAVEETGGGHGTGDAPAQEP